MKSWNKSLIQVDLVYPNKSYGGYYSLGLLILYNIINNQKNFITKRHFLDQNKLTSDLIGFTFQYEPDYYNFIKILKQNKIPLTKNRKQIIFAGGPCINQNPKPIEKYIDFFVTGEAEEILPKILKVYEQNRDKKTFIKKIEKLKGIYVPGKKFTLSTIKDLDKYPYPLHQPLPKKIDKNFVFGRAFILEIERGCPFNCHFCSIRSIHDKVKYRSLKKIKDIIDQGIKINKVNKVVIYSPSFAHPKRKEILKYLIKKKLQFSIPSIKVELVDDDLLDLIKKGGQKTLTIAPESNQRLRYTLNKHVSDEKYFNFIKKAKEKGFKIKLYFMVGIPNTTTKDLDELIEFINKARCSSSINPFVPKPKTSLGKHKFNKTKVKQEIKYLKKHLKTKVKFANVRFSYEEWKLAHTNELY